MATKKPAAQKKVVKKEPAVKKKTGRPSSYKPEYNVLVYKLGLLGLDNKAIADNIGVSIQTMYTWGKEHPEFLDALKSSKERADSEVCSALYKRAVGFREKVVRPMVVSLGQGAGSEIQYAEYEEYFPPDVSAARYWMNNRQKAHWANIPRTEEEGEVAAIPVQVVFAPTDCSKEVENKEQENKGAE